MYVYRCCRKKTDVVTPDKNPPIRELALYPGIAESNVKPQPNPKNNNNSKIPQNLQESDYRFKS